MAVLIVKIHGPVGTKLVVTMFCALILAALTTPVAEAKKTPIPSAEVPKLLLGHWKGAWTYGGGRRGKANWNVTVAGDGKLEGLTEMEGAGRRSDTKGQLIGTYDGNKIRAQLQGALWDGRELHYKLEMIRKKGNVILKGKWQTGGASGSFRLEKQP